MRKLFYVLTFFFLHLILAPTLEAQTSDDYTLSIVKNIRSEFREVIFEGCTDLDITITRDTNQIGIPLMIPFTLSGDAKLGVDYTMVYNDSVEITSSTEFIIMDTLQSSIKLDIKTIYDGVDESNELLTVNFEDFNTLLGNKVTPSEKVNNFRFVEQPELKITTIPDDDMNLRCPGDTALIEVKLSGGVGALVNNNYSYQWNQIGVDDIQTFFPIDTTEYIVRATDICTTQYVFDTVTVNVRPFKDYEDITVKLDTTFVCEEDELGELCVTDVMGGQGSLYTYAWSTSDSESILSTDSCLVATYGKYEVSVSDICEFTPYEDSNVIYNDEAPNPMYEYLSVPDSTIMLEFNNYTPLMEGLTHEWFFQNLNDTSNVIQYLPNQYPVRFNGEHKTTVLVGDSINPVTIKTAGTYDVKLKVTTQNAGCVKEYSEYITLEPSYFFYAPNAFTPNGDALNDTFRPIVTGTKSYEFFVYDSFGKVVYSSSDRLEEWDGTYKGKPAAEGIYIYKVVMIKQSDVVVFSEQGTVTLLR